MAEDQDQSQKTEEPTQKRLDDARKKGDIAKSTDVPIWFMMFGGAALVVMSSSFAAQLGQTLKKLLDHPHAFTVSSNGAMDLMHAILIDLAPIAAVVFGVLMLSAFVGHLIQHRPLWTAEKIKPKMSKLSLVQGVQRMLGPQGWMNFFKSILKLIAIAAAVTYAAWPYMDMLPTAAAMELGVFVFTIKEIAIRLFIASLVVVGMIAAMDFAWQKQSFMKRMRMSRQEIKDEHKQSDGDPLVKAKIRQLRQERSRRRMIAEVPNATVIINNPTHYSIALKYDDETPAPICIAKGVDEVALRIREAAIEADVPMVENPPLARALYASVEIDDIIPEEHFAAVAKIIGYVMRTKRN